MKNRSTIAPNNQEELWNRVYTDFVNFGTNDYHVTIQYNGHSIDLDLVSSPGGGAEGGYEYTIITAPLPQHSRLSFSIQPEDFLKKIGKFFGAQDVIVGYPDFDENVIVKSNDEQQLKKLFANADVRQVFQSLSGYSFGVVEDEDKEGQHLELLIQRALTNLPELQKIFNAYLSVLDELSAQP